MTSAAGPDHEQTVALPEGLGAAAVARRETREVLKRWRMLSVLDDVVLSVSELVTNAVVHGRPRIWLVLRRRRAAVDVAVHDERPLRPATMHGSNGNQDAESGRGLQIVEEVSDGVRFQDVPGDGKFVSASFPAPADGAAGPQEGSA